MLDDKQIIEVLGRNRLVDELILAGLEVALPVRDRGIDLIAYIDLQSEAERFLARPIQMKASSAASWALDRKYERINGLLIAYVWHLDDPKQAVTYAMTYAEAEAVLTKIGWAENDSWKVNGRYARTEVGESLLRLLRPHMMNAEKWREIVTAGA